MLLGVMPWQVFAEGELPVEVTFVRKDNTEEKVSFTDENQQLGLNGTPAQTGFWFTKSYFIGWSNNKDYMKNGEGFLLYNTATVSDLLKEMKGKNITLYALYASAGMSNLVEDTAVMINDDVPGKDFVNFDEKDVNKSGNKTTANIREADLGNDAVKYEIKTLKSEFVMNKFAQAAIYKNPWVGALENGSTWADLSKKSGKGIDGSESFYGNVTVVDLHVHVDERLVLPDEFELAFTSYTFRPYSVFSEKNADGTVVKPGEAYPYIGVDNPGGKERYGVLESIKDNEPTTKFKVKSYLTNDAGEKVPVHDFVVRTRMRISYDQYGKRIEPATMEQIQSNMKLELASGTFEVPKEEAFKIAKGEADPITIRGYINGTVKRIPIQGYGEEDDKIKSEDEVLTFKLVKEEPQPEPKPEPNPDNGGMWILPGGGKKEEATEDHMAYIFGYPDKSVRPEGNLTRAEAAAMVTRLGRLDLSDTSKAAYPDLKDGAWYLPYINAALKAGMLDTDDAGNLRPDAPVTRGEFVKMIAAIDRPSEGKAPFTDIAGHKYEKEINQVYGNRRAIGYEDGSFKPDNTLTRAESAAFLNRVFNRVADDVAVGGFEACLAKFTDLQKGSWFYYELVEATNSHQLVRRGGQDDLARDYERWTNLWYDKVAK